MLGLKRGSVLLVPHQEEWHKNAKDIISIVKTLINDIILDIQHIGSTSICTIQAKPIVDIIVGLKEVNDILPYIEVLKKYNFIFRGEDIAGQILFIKGDIANTLRTHHIHIVQWNSTAWNNYINFRDYLNTHPEKARIYEARKRELALQFPDDRKQYTAGKQELIERLLHEARGWKAGA